MSALCSQLAINSGQRPTLLAPELSGASWISDERNGRLTHKGRRASVYPLRLVDGQTVALRVFTAGGHELADRYCAIATYLAQHRLPALVDCRYLNAAVSSSEFSEPIPIVLMDWAPGVTLDAWVADQIGASHRDVSAAAASLVSMADRWHELTKALLACDLVHGNLEPRNVMVEPSGQLRLVDYDNLCPPALLGKATPHVGTLPYQHPGRHARTPAFAGLDHFAALTIYVSLRGLSADARLWSLHARGNEDAVLLFCEDDLASAANRSLLKALLASPDQQVRDLAHYLAQLHQGQLRDVPPIDEVLLWCNSVEALLSQGDFDRATQLVGRVGSTERIDAALLSKIDNAWQRVNCRRALQAAVDSGELCRIQSEYRHDLLADYPAAAPLAEQARRLLNTAARLAEIAAARQEKRWDDFARLWVQHGHEVGEISGADQFHALYETIERVRSLENLLSDPASDETELVRLWQQLFTHGEPPLADRLHGARQRRVARQKLLVEIDDLLQRTSRAPTYDADRHLRVLWKQAEELGETGLESRRPHYRLAKLRMKRVRWLNDLAKAPTLAGEQHVAACLRYLPPTYHANLPQRIQLARQRLDRIRKLELALLEPVSERGLLRAWRGVAAAQGETLVPSQWQQRVELAKRRVQLIEHLKALSRLPSDQRDQQVLKLWDDSLFAGCSEAASIRPLLDEANIRTAALAKLIVALDANDTVLAQRVLTAPELQNHKFAPDLQARIDTHRSQLAQAHQARRHGLVQAVLNHDLDRFRQLFDCELVADLCAHVPQHQALVSGWIEREILPLGKSGLKAFGPGLIQHDGLHWRATWLAPSAAIANRALLTISRDRPKPHAIPCDLELFHGVEVLPLTDGAEPVTVEFTIEPAWRGAHVFAWAVIELGFQTFYSEPLSVGPLRPPDR
jgi:hypothetical protein